MVLMIDNYDSFTYNLVQYFQELGEVVEVYRNNEISLTEIEIINPNYLVISPGPCTPDDAGISLEVIRHFAGKIPILGICLGHQSLAQVFGASVIAAKHIMHGKTSNIFHKDVGVFYGLTNGYVATRYHSLVVEQMSLPTCLEITAWTENQNGELEEIMGLKHKKVAVEGVQFHPESILTEFGRDLLANFLKR